MQIVLHVEVSEVETEVTNTKSIARRHGGFLFSIFLKGI